MNPRAGVVQIPWGDVNPNWVPYIAVEDVAAVAARGRRSDRPEDNRFSLEKAF